MELEKTIGEKMSEVMNTIRKEYNKEASDIEKYEAEIERLSFLVKCCKRNAKNLKNSYNSLNKIWLISDDITDDIQ